MTSDRWKSSSDWQTLHHLTAKLQSLLAGLVISDDWDSLLVLNFRSKKASAKLPSNSVCTWFDLTTEKWQPPPILHNKTTILSLRALQKRHSSWSGSSSPISHSRIGATRFHRVFLSPLVLPFCLWMPYDTVAWRGVRVLESSIQALHPAALCCFTPCGGTERRQDWYN